MSRSFRDVVKFSVPTFLFAAALAGCGSGSGGSADLDQGGSVTSPPPSITVTETFNFKATADYFVVGTTPTHARFSGGQATGNGAWVIPAGQTGVVDFGTPADAVKFSTKDNYTATAAADSGAQKSTQPASRAKMDFPFDRPMYVRGLNGDFAPQEPYQLKEVSGLDNVLERVIALQVWSGDFKVADPGWGQDINEVNNCGKNDDSDTIIFGAPYQLLCKKADKNNIKIDVTEAGNYLFRFDARNPDNITLTITKDTGGGGDGDGDGGGEPEDSTEIRIYAVDVLTPGSQPTLLNTVKGTGTLSVEELRQGGATRITRIEIENKGTAGNVGVEDFQWTANPRFTPEPVSVDILYRRTLPGQTTGTKITVGSTTYDCKPIPQYSQYECIVEDIPLPPFSNSSMSVANADGTTETITFNAGDGSEVLAGTCDAAFAISGSPVARDGIPIAGTQCGISGTPDEVVLYYKRADNNYVGWGLHLFPLDPQGDSWTKYELPYAYAGIDPQWGAFFRIKLPGKESPRYSNNPEAISTFPTALGFIIHKYVAATGAVPASDTKDPGPDQVIRVGENGNLVFVVSGVNDVSSTPPSSGTTLRVAGSAAHWVDGTTLLWSPAQSVTKVELLYSPNGSISSTVQGITGTYETIALTSGTNPKPEFNKQLHTLKAWSLPATATAKARDLARGQLVVVGRNASNEAISATNVQFPGALDALYAEKAAAKSLGVSYVSGVPSLAVWAPTALKDPGLTVNVYDEAGTKIESKPMTLDEESGVWTVTGTAAWDLKFYTISLRVFSYAANAIVTNEVTDPYSVSLATDSVRSQFVDLDDVALKPAGWDTMTLPALAAPEEIVLYELHVRDFSIADPSVPTPVNPGDPDHRGKFTAFDREIVGDTNGLKHLQALATAGLTHVHLLPTFDFATVKENAADQVNLGDKVEKLCAANSAAASLCTTDAGKTIRQAMLDAVAANQLDRPQQITEWMRGLDGFNWGYDPLHFGVPEGSYSTNPNGTTRILEFRRMVKGLNALGLRTVIDVVYNHTNASGQNSRATLDRLVPGYYHRRDNTSGDVLKDTCCDDTAAEFKMMEKLMIDTGVQWVRDYKVTGFRFDLMGFHPLETMRRFQDAVKAENSSVYIYGEGWNFGAVKDDARFTQARQARLGGTGIGSFSDRIRDPVRGGSNFSDSGAADVENQGFISGNFYAPNSSNSGSTAEREDILNDSDNIRVWIAGGLASYRLTDAKGATVTGADIDYFGQKSGYTKDPQEAINYISKHDDETVWDISQYKHATGTLLADRVRADNVGTALVMLGQGIPFIHAGTELLRSKSLDRNSYDSGDWYNEIDWLGDTSKWNQGLPRATDNLANYDQIKNVILDATAAQDYAARQAALANFKELLAIRKSSPLFRLRTQSQIDQRLKFYNTGPFQIPGVIAMAIDGCTEPNLTPAEGALMVIFNASDDPRTLDLFGTETWTLHPVQQGSADAVVKTAKHDANGFYVPARTTAVFRRASQTSCAPYPLDMFVRGGFNDWGSGDQYKLQFLGGTSYSVSAPISVPGNYEFKIADKDWGNTTGGLTDCGALNAGATVRLGVPSTLACPSVGNNLKISTTIGGDYTFALEAADTSRPVLTVTKTPPTPLTLYVRGGFTDWGLSLPMVWDGAGTYRATGTAGSASVGVQYFFKIADADWGNTNSGATNCGGAAGSTPTVTLGTPFGLTCAADPPNLGITFPSAGSYLFAVNWSNPASPQLTVEKVPVEELYVRGAFNDWGQTDRLSYLGGGTYALNKALAATAAEFKVADANYNPVNCGGGAGGNTVTVGATLALACGSNPPNLSLTPPSAGTYTFTVKINDATSGELTVTGP